MSERIITLNESAIKQELGEMVRKSVEDTLNTLLDEEADRLTNATRYERTENRLDTRAGHYKRKLWTKAGEVERKMPKLRTLPFETAIIQRYQKREIRVEEALVEMYLAGVSVRRVEDITEALWGAKVSAGTVSKLNQKVYVKIEEWRQRKLLMRYPYVYLDGIYLKRNWGGSYENVAILVAMAVNEDGQREVIGAAEGAKEDRESWCNFLVSLKERGLTGTELFIADKCLGLLEAIHTVFPKAKYQRCTIHFYRNVFTTVPRSKGNEVSAMLKAIHAQEDQAAAKEKAKAVIQKLRDMKRKEAAKKVEDSVWETLTYMTFPHEHWVKIRTIERLNREIRRRTRVVGAFPDSQSALMLVCARLRYMESSLWGTKCYLNMKHLENNASNENEVMTDSTAA